MNILLAEIAGRSWQSFLLLAGCGIVGYLLVFFTNPAFPFFRDGFRCIRRYPQVWLWLSVLALSYSIVQMFQAYQLDELQFSLTALFYWPVFTPPNWWVAAGRAWLPALELLSGLFNQAVVSYPISGLAALLFLVNWHGHQNQFLAAAKKRLGRWWLAAYLGLLLCALAALAKPIFLFSIYWLNEVLDAVLLLRLGAVIDWLSFQFEYLFGLLMQVAIVLTALIWIRGLNANPGRIFRLAVKRGVYAAKWVAIVMAATFLLIHLPLLISYLWIGQHTDFTNAVIEYVTQTARPLLSIGMILFCSVQITLILKNETLREAILEHAQLTTKHTHRIIWFLLVAWLHLFGICWLGEYLAGSYPKYAVPNLLLAVALALAKVFAVAWLLASWVCLYRHSQGARKDIRF